MQQVGTMLTDTVRVMCAGYL